MQPDERAKPAEMTWPDNYGEQNYQQFGRQTSPNDITGGGDIQSPAGFAGQIVIWPTVSPPPGWLVCDGTAYAAADYPNLFEVLSPFVGAFTTDHVANTITCTNHGLHDLDVVQFFSEDTLPDGLDTTPKYSIRFYVELIDENTFYVNSTPILTGDSSGHVGIADNGTGIHHVRKAAYGVSFDGLTYNFQLPDLKSKYPRGHNYDEEHPLTAGYYIGLMGFEGGEVFHTLTEAQLATHTHIQDAHTHTQNAHTHTQNSHNHTTFSGSVAAYITANGSVGIGAGSTDSTLTNPNTGDATAVNQNTTATNQNTTATNQNTGSSAPFNVMDPFLNMQYIIKT